MRKIFLISILLFYTTALCENYEDGISAYNLKEYNKAASIFQKLLQSNQNSSSLHYNLGNTFFNLESYGKAIYHYRKALLINPNDPRSIHNLSLTRKKINTQNNSQINNYLLTPLKILNKTQIRIVFLTFLLTSCLLIGIYPLHPYKGTIAFCSILTIYLAALSFFTSYSKYGDPLFSNSINLNVVSIDKINAYASRDEQSQVIEIISSGTELVADSNKDNWYRVLLKNEKKAWIPTKNIKLLNF